MKELDDEKTSTTKPSAVATPSDSRAGSVAPTGSMNGSQKLEEAQKVTPQPAQVKEGSDDDAVMVETPGQPLQASGVSTNTGTGSVRSKKKKGKK